ncbi:MAG: enoyl-CoA hydratase-related protein [Sinobacteraceae bacterium]|nr:enoyl-CoA hydratase-related protein [Nevskiaceae bacterium]
MSAEARTPVLVERDGSVGLVLLNRPERRNVLDLEMRAAIARAVTALVADEAVRVLVVSGGNELFAAGADLKLLVDKDPHGVAGLDLPGYWAPLARCPKPVIAAVNGVAFGAGSELMLMCDIIVVDRSAKIGQPEIRVGIMPGAGGTQRLVRAVGRPVASLMLMSGVPLSGERAYQLGLASELVETGQALVRARELAAQVAQMPPKALAAIKRVLWQGADLPLDAALALENREFLLLFGTADQKEGMSAFLEKRSPRFTGN